MGLSFELVLIELLLLYGAKVNQKKTMCYCMLWFNPSLAAFHVSIYIKNAPNFLSTCKIKEVEAIDKLCVHQQIHYQHVCTNRYIINMCAPTDTLSTCVHQQIHYQHVCTNRYIINMCAPTDTLSTCVHQQIHYQHQTVGNLACYINN